MNLVEVKRISYYPPSKGYAVLLQEKDSDRSLPIIVGSSEAQAIALYLEGVDMPRPMTHDLLINVLENLEGEINRVTIARINKGTFFAEIEVSNPQIGEMIMNELKKIDNIAYIRFASVYREFKDVDDFQSHIRGLKNH
mgnify:CR=1 FL=1